jgi:hypothetical protein
LGELEVSVHCKAHDNINFVKQKVKTVLKQSHSYDQDKGHSVAREKLASS